MGSRREEKKEGMAEATSATPANKKAVVVGVRAGVFVDIDPRKVGRVVRGARVIAPEALTREGFAVVVAVGSVGARSLIRGRLWAMGCTEGPDFVVAA